MPTSWTTSCSGHLVASPTSSADGLNPPPRRDRRTTAVAYTTAVRAFFRYLDRRRWLNPEQSYERIKDGLRELVGVHRARMTFQPLRAAAADWTMLATSAASTHSSAIRTVRPY